MDKRELTAAMEEIKQAGMTISGWARSRGFSINSVKNVLYRGQTSGPSCELIIAKLKEEGML